MVNFLRISLPQHAAHLSRVHVAVCAYVYHPCLPRYLRNIEAIRWFVIAKDWYVYARYEAGYSLLTNNNVLRLMIFNFRKWVTVIEPPYIIILHIIKFKIVLIIVRIYIARLHPISFVASHKEVIIWKNKE